VLARVAADLDGAAAGDAFVWATPPRETAGDDASEGAKVEVEDADEDAHLEEDPE